MPPQLDGGVEVTIEGISADEFPATFSGIFAAQHATFVCLYALLSLRLSAQFCFAEHLRLRLNRQYVALCVQLGCFVRVAYIVSSDMTASGAPLEYVCLERNTLSESF